MIKHACGSCKYYMGGECHKYNEPRTFGNDRGNDLCWEGYEMIKGNFRKLMYEAEKLSKGKQI